MILKIRLKYLKVKKGLSLIGFEPIRKFPELFESSVSTIPPQRLFNEKVNCDEN